MQSCIPNIITRTPFSSTRGYKDGQAKGSAKVVNCALITANGKAKVGVNVALNRSMALNHGQNYLKKTKTKLNSNHYYSWDKSNAIEQIC